MYEKMRNRYHIRRGGWLLVILLSFLYIGGCLPNFTSLSGILLDQSSFLPVSGARIFFGDNSVISDSDGHFFFSSVPYGVISLYIEVPFYKDREYSINVDHPDFVISSPIYLIPFEWKKEEGYYIYQEDDKFKIYSTIDGVNFSEENLLEWGDDLIEKMNDIVNNENIIPFKIYTCWPEDEVTMDEIKAFTVFSSGEIHILKNMLKIKEEDVKKEIFAHEFTHLFLYRYAHITEPFIQEGLAFYFPSFILGYGRSYDYTFYRRELIRYFHSSHIPTWKEAGEIYSHPEDTDLFWFSLYELRSIFYFLGEKYGKERVISFFIGLKDVHDNFDDLFLKIYGKNMEELEKEWKEFFNLLEKEKGAIKEPPVNYIY